MAYLHVEPDDTERDSFNRSLCCGELSSRPFGLGRGCGARNWRVIRKLAYPPWTRLLICLNCGLRVEVELPDWKAKLLGRPRHASPQVLDYPNTRQPTVVGHSPDGRSSRR